MASKRLIAGPRLLCCHPRSRYVLMSSPLLGRRSFHQTPLQADNDKQELRRRLVAARLQDAKPLLTADQGRRFYRSPRTRLFLGGCVLAAVIFYFQNRETVPVSGRKRFNCYGDGVSKLSDQMVKRVMYEAERQGHRILPEHDHRYGNGHIPPARDTPLTTC